MGDIVENTGKVIRTLERYGPQKPDLLVFPELFLQGYPPRDLLEHRWFIHQGLAAIEQICEVSTRFEGIGILVGCAMPDSVPNGRGLFNSAVLICEGEILFHQNKALLPSYDVFDETRYFDPAISVKPYVFKGTRLGISICEDAWNVPGMWERSLYQTDPLSDLADAGVDVMINLSASPFHLNKGDLRYSLMREHARRHKVPFVFVNQVGGNDELIFDGAGMAFDRTGALQMLIPSFTEAVKVYDTDTAVEPMKKPEFDSMEMVEKALVAGVRDYVTKCGFHSALVGLSGGIDSAVTCTLAVEALGADKVTGIAMPTSYSSPGSVEDARKLADNLGIKFKVVPIEECFQTALATLKPHFEGRGPDVTEENLQARIRGNVLMAFSNKFGSLLLATGNKSELAVGYCTLYGDMNGGLSVISDLPKTMVYRLAEHLNRAGERIPQNTITKPPSAELKPGQQDSDSLPPYKILDEMLRLLIEEGKSSEELIKAGFDHSVVKWIVDAISRNEYKRRQAAPGLKISPKAFGSGRRFPIAARYKW